MLLLKYNPTPRRVIVTKELLAKIEAMRGKSFDRFTLLAAYINDMPLEWVTKEQRAAAKRDSYWAIYSTSAWLDEELLPVKPIDIEGFRATIDRLSAGAIQTTESYKKMVEAMAVGLHGISSIRHLDGVLINGHSRAHALRTMGYDLAAGPDQHVTVTGRVGRGMAGLLDLTQFYVATRPGKLVREAQPQEPKQGFAKNLRDSQEAKRQHKPSGLIAALTQKL